MNEESHVCLRTEQGKYKDPPPSPRPPAGVSETDRAVSQAGAIYMHLYAPYSSQTYV